MKLWREILVALVGISSLVLLIGLLCSGCATSTTPMPILTTTADAPMPKAAEAMTAVVQTNIPPPTNLRLIWDDTSTPYLKVDSWQVQARPVLQYGQWTTAGVVTSNEFDISPVNASEFFRVGVATYHAIQ